MNYKIGEHLEISRGLYHHHGVFINDEKVIHFSVPKSQLGGGDDGIDFPVVLGEDSKSNKIHEADFDDFKLGGVPKIVEYEDDYSYPPLKIVARAKSRLGQKGYNLYGNNCEHFIRWCIIAESTSLQISFWQSTLKGGAVGGGLGSAAGAASGALLGAASGAVVGILHEWSSRRKKLLPVYQEFSDYSVLLYLSTKRAHPFGKSFKHGSQVDDGTEAVIPHDKKDKNLLFYYSGSWLFGSGKDWFITERAIIYPKKEIYVNFHNVNKIYSRMGSLMIEDIEGRLYKLPSGFISASGVASFLNDSVITKPMPVSSFKDFKVSFKSKLKEGFKILIGGLILALIAGYFFPIAVPWIIVAIVLVAFLSPFQFMDENEHYEEHKGLVFDKYKSGIKGNEEEGEDENITS